MVGVQVTRSGTALALKVEGLVVQHELIDSVISHMKTVGEHTSDIKTLKGTIAILTALVLGQWAAIIALWKALP